MISFLVLDYNRPGETYQCLKSIRQNAKFDNQIIYLSNGGNQDYVFDFYRQGLMDKVILNKENSGLGFGTTDLFRMCNTDYAIYFQNDQWLAREFTQQELDEMLKIIDRIYPDHTQRKVKSIGLAGDPCQGQYSERAHLIRTAFYNNIPDMPNGGAGPYHHIEWNEGYIQKWYKHHGLLHYIWPKPLVGDNGCFALRENPDGSKWRHRTDTKELWLLGGPVKEKYIYPNFTQEEWDEVLKAQAWPNGRIPLKEQAHSFRFWQ